VEAQQCVKLTGTNSSIGFIALIILVHPTIGPSKPRPPESLQDLANPKILPTQGDVQHQDSGAGLQVQPGAI
jgi:hypothetical protein